MCNHKMITKMKKTYLSPKIEMILLKSMPLMNVTSPNANLNGGGDDGGTGVGDSKAWAGTLLWDDTEE